MNDLFSIFSIGEFINRLDKNIVINFTSAKFYFAELMFDYEIRTLRITTKAIWTIIFIRRVLLLPFISVSEFIIIYIIKRKI